MMIRRRDAILGLLVCLAMAAPALAADKVRVLIIDGQNNHDWKAMTPPMKAALEATGRFTVEVATTPPRDASADSWASFRPVFSQYDAVLSNYNGQPWPDAVQLALEDYVSGGGGLVIIHAANNAFPGWAEYNKMIGLGWRDNKFGDRLTVDDEGKVVLTPKGEGPGAGHGPQHEYKVVTRRPDHPIMKGLPKEWMHARDELYQGQRGPALDMEILATAFADTSQKGTGTNEPIAWVIPYGKGRVFVNVMGHVGGKEGAAIRCVGFETLVARGTEWAATGQVTIPVPKNFPTDSQVSLDDSSSK